MPGGYFWQGTSENSVKRKFNFVELMQGELRRIPLPGTRVNKVMMHLANLLAQWEIPANLRTFPANKQNRLFLSCPIGLKAARTIAVEKIRSCLTDVIWYRTFLDP